MPKFNLGDTVWCAYFDGGEVCQFEVAMIALDKDGTWYSEQTVEEAAVGLDSYCHERHARATREEAEADLAKMEARKYE